MTIAVDEKFSYKIDVQWYLTFGKSNLSFELKIIWNFSYQDEVDERDEGELFPLSDSFDKLEILWAVACPAAVVVGGPSLQSFVAILARHKSWSIQLCIKNVSQILHWYEKVIQHPQKSNRVSLKVNFYLKSSFLWCSFFFFLHASFYFFPQCIARLSFCLRLKLRLKSG